MFSVRSLFLLSYSSNLLSPTVTRFSFAFYRVGIASNPFR